jgi:uncharacterized membrane protein
MIFAEIVHTDTLLKVVWASLVTGVGVTSVFSLAIFGAVRFVDSRRDGRVLEAWVYGVLLTVSLLASAGAVLLGVVVMTTK